jgi:hypothetical protein
MRALPFVGDVIEYSFARVWRELGANAKTGVGLREASKVAFASTRPVVTGADDSTNLSRIRRKDLTEATRTGPKTKKLIKRRPTTQTRRKTVTTALQTKKTKTERFF